jgi:hypothetical protein
MRFLDVAKFTTLTPLSLLILCKLSFPIVGLKMSSPSENVTKFLVSCYNNRTHDKHISYSQGEASDAKLFEMLKNLESSRNKVSKI